MMMIAPNSRAREERGEEKGKYLELEGRRREVLTTWPSQQHVVLYEKGG